MNKVIPAILEKEWPLIEEKLNSLKGITDTVHIDFITGSNETFFDPTPFSKFKEDFILGVHFIGDDPIEHLDTFAKVGFKSFIGQIENMSDQEEFIARGQLLGEVGLSIDGPTDINALKVNLYDLDFLLIMTVNAGASGQKFEEKYLEKVKYFKEKALDSERELTIAVDGGINEETIIKAKEAGANIFMANSYIFNGNPVENFQKLKSLLST
jgi:ribulose-phosphate 3-epimerase